MNSHKKTIRLFSELYMYGSLRCLRASLTDINPTHPNRPKG